MNMTELIKENEKFNVRHEPHGDDYVWSGTYVCKGIDSRIINGKVVFYYVHEDDLGQRMMTEVDRCVRVEE